jgi:hypothetical protein
MNVISKARRVSIKFDIYVFIRLSLLSTPICKLEHHNDGIVLTYGIWKAYHYKAYCRHVTYLLLHDVCELPECVLYYILR